MKTTIREYFNEGETGCNNFYDWFCKDSSLPAKQLKLDAKLRKLSKSPKINIDTMHVFYKNNCPVNGVLYDDMRFCDVNTSDVVYAVIPSSGHNVNKGRAEVWGVENNFKTPLVVGKWKDVCNFFGV